uniref:Alpha-2-macroglobulin n=1 Tax=Neogobius melanostomus TaxID=47308 RepID=A0A8C6SZT6_9GOBI
MDCLGVQMRAWVLFVTFGWVYLGQAAAGPYYMVAVPAILGSGAEVKFCARLLQPNESLTTTVTLMSQNLTITLYKKESRQEFDDCHKFMAPIVPKDEAWNLQVEVSGETFYSREVRKVLIRVNKPVTFIQTDKPIYLPGQTVHFRLVTLDTNLRPACRKYDMIELEDANGNRIGQWLKQTSAGKILQLSHPLNTEAKEGTYQISVSFEEDRIFHNFKVEKYVLPKFDVKITSDDEVSIAQEEISVKICAKYTYGQPVPGTLKLEICRPFDQYVFREVDDSGNLSEVTSPCHKESKQADKEGCATFTVPMSTFTKLDPKAVQDSLEIIAKMEEEGTGITHSHNSRVSISYVIGKLSFFDTPKVYEKDTTVEGKVKALRYNDQPLANMDLYLFEGERWSSRHLQNLTTDNNGVATFSLDTAGHNGNIRLHVSDKPVLEYVGYRVPYHETGDITLSMAQQSSPDTKTVSLLEVKKTERALPCGSEEEITIHYTVVQEAQGPMDINYLVIGRNDIVMQEFQKIVVTDNTVTEGSISFKLPITAALAPNFVVVAFAVLPSSYVIAHSAEFNTEKCFSHKVEVKFNPDEGVPGEDATLQVSGHPDSLCGISVIDQSVLIQEPGKYLKAEMIYNLLPRNRYVPYEVRDPTQCLPVRPKRSIIPYPVNVDDAFTVFQNAGLKILTNLMIRVPDCLHYLGREYHYGRHYVQYGTVSYSKVPQRVAMNSPVGGSGFGAGAAPPVIETVRTFFPETWIWDLVETGEFGKADMPVKIPDTITTWETEAFCLSSQGFGLAPRKNFTVFQPFFLELSLPYSIIRGENFELKATVFNYLTSCMMVAVTPAPTDDYTLTLVPGLNYKFCLCGNERKTVSWNMSPTALGTVDVIVSAEAVSSDVSCNNEIVEVPVRGRIDKVTKKLIVKAEGIEMVKTHNLLLCPKDQTLTEEIDVQLPDNVIVGSDRAMVSVMGYQRQLNYKHDDGAYSAFGTGSGNTWLTAFVLRSFVKAKNFIYIDPAKIEESKLWLQSKQMPSGCFEKVGKLFHNEMKGGVSDEVTLTAYISAALLEMGLPADDPVLAQSLNCLTTSEGVQSNTYTTALMSYVFTLAHNATARNPLLSHLDTVAHTDGGLRHWSQTSAETSASLSVEISSYGLLAKLGSSNPTASDLGYAAQIVRWLIKQQNYYGGFSSTQDTVVALQALTRYSSLVYSPGGQSTVTVKPPSGAPLVFQVNQNNKLLYQEQSLPDVTGIYTVEANGDACAAIQVTVMYNIPIPNEPTPFSLKVAPKADCDNNLLRPRMTLNIKAQYNGKAEISNMAVIDIKILSGFSVDSESLNALKSVPPVKRVDKEEDHVLIYLDGVPKDILLSYELMVIRERTVYNLKPAVVHMYDYYQPSDKVETDYTFSC